MLSSVYPYYLFYHFIFIHGSNTYMCIYIYIYIIFLYYPLTQRTSSDECKDSKEGPLKPDFDRFINANNFDNNDDDDYSLPPDLMRLIE